MPWDPDQYLKFKAERYAPFEDLVQLIKVRPGLRVVDLGCGTGELTRRLADRLPDSKVLGLDLSPAMLAHAREYARPGLRFARGDVRELEGTWDLIFSHAALQWVEDHERLFARLWERLAPGGQLVVQMPANHDHPTHAFLRELAQEEPFAPYFPRGGRRSPVLPVEAYAELFYRLGAAEIVACLKVYPHVLANADALVEWTKGTALIPYLEALPSDLHSAFLTRYRERLRARFPETPVFYGFKRVLLAATRS